MSKPFAPIVPFRWSLQKRSQLGRMIEGPTEAFYRGFLDDLVRCCSRIIAFGGNSDLVFVGRSAESIFDHLSGLLLATRWGSRLSLLHFSMRWTDKHFIRRNFPGALPGMRSYLEHLKLSPDSIVARPRSVVLVDLVYSGGTFGNLVELLHDWARETAGDWKAVRRKLRLIGLTERAKTSPKTWRWQQHADWLWLITGGAVKNVSIPGRMWEYLGDDQQKVTPSHTPERWANPECANPSRTPSQLRALRLAVNLFDLGRQETARRRFAMLLSREREMEHSWLRGLVQEL